MNSKYLKAGALSAGLSVIVGAFGAHLLKAALQPETLESFETGVRYQMYHGLALILLAIIPLKKTKWIYRSFLWGTILFAGSIYALCLDELLGVKFSFLGPVTPLGGLLLILGWVQLFLKGYQAKLFK